MPSTVQQLKAAGTGLLEVVTRRFQQRRRLKKAILANRLELTTHGDDMEGAGAQLLRTLLSKSQFVLLGEDHGVAQIPQLARWVWKQVAAQGCRTLAAETGAISAEVLLKWLADGASPRSLAEHLAQYPDSIAIFDIAEESRFLTECYRTRGGQDFRLIGLDQEYPGAFPIADDRCNRECGAPLRDCLRGLRSGFDEAYSEAVRLGDPNVLFSTAFTDNDLAELRQLVEGRRTPHERMLSDWLRSWEIYRSYANGNFLQSNRDRARLMKERVRECLACSPEKIVFKLGAFHLYRGLNPVHNLDVGNLIAEYAEASQVSSLHVLVMGIDGTCLTAKGIGGEYHPERFDLARDAESPFLPLKPFFRSAFRDRWTVFDLRGLRGEFPYFGAIHVEIERIVFGYDLMVFIPDALPSEPISQGGVVESRSAVDATHEGAKEILV